MEKESVRAVQHDEAQRLEVAREVEAAFCWYSIWYLMFSTRPSNGIGYY